MLRVDDDGKEMRSRGAAVAAANAVVLFIIMITRR